MKPCKLFADVLASSDEGIEAMRQALLEKLHPDDVPGAPNIENIVKAANPDLLATALRDEHGYEVVAESIGDIELSDFKEDDLAEYLREEAMFEIVVKSAADVDFDCYDIDDLQSHLEANDYIVIPRISEMEVARIAELIYILAKEMQRHF